MLFFRNDSGAGNLITFSQFAFVSLCGIIFTTQFFTIKRVISLRDYAILVLIFFVSNVCNNYALSFNVPMPLMLIFRSGSLIANMILGHVILKKRYTRWKYFSASLITFGILICTLASRMDVKSDDFDEYSMIKWTIAVILMTISLLLTARMGIYQETLVKKYGKFPEEMLFYSHFLAMPTFIPLLPNIVSHLVVLMDSVDILPNQLVFLIFNIFTHYLCIKSVYILTAECTSLTVTLVVTLRKFASLIFSIFYFNNPFTNTHWIGTLFIFIGTVIFTEIIPKIRATLK